MSRFYDAGVGAVTGLVEDRAPERLVREIASAYAPDQPYSWPREGEDTSSGPGEHEGKPWEVAGSDLTDHF